MPVAALVAKFFVPVAASVAKCLVPVTASLATCLVPVAALEESSVTLPVVFFCSFNGCVSSYVTSMFCCVPYSMCSIFDCIATPLTRPPGCTLT